MTDNKQKSVAAIHWGRHRHALSRSGNFVLLLIMFLLLFLFGAGVVGGLFFFGQKADDRIDAAVQTGFAAIQKEQADVAIVAFRKVLQEEGVPLRFFQAVQKRRGLEITPPEDIRQALVSALLMKAYESLIQLKPAPIETTDAVAAAALIPLPAGDEYRKLAATAREVSGLCEQFQKKKYEPLMKALLQAEKRALRSDQDFVLMEVRLLIGVGKALKEPIILTRARELLYFISFEAGIKNSRTNRLWGLLNR
ncbi:MAG: hypothetical protein WA705_19065 [Candidatus Ozemobacteraceae bacterium]